MPRESQLMRDLAGIDAMQAMANRQGLPPIPVVTRVSDLVGTASGSDPIESSPRDAEVSDHYRVSSPNRNRGRDDGTMRHRRIKR